MRRWCLAVLVLLGLGSPSLAQPNGPLPQPLPLFPPDNWWNTDIRHAPVDPRSQHFLEAIGLDRGMHPDFGGDEAPGDPANPGIYGMVYISVGQEQPLVPVRFVEYPEESDAGAPGRPPGYPIPEAAKTEPRWIEGGWPGHVDAGGDRHMLIVDRDRRLLFELYHTRWNALAGRWEAGSGAAWRLGENGRRPDGWTSADAAGLAILPGLVRHDEVFGPDPIRHAFRVTVSRTNGAVYPASHAAGNHDGALPMGARLRLKAGVDLSGFPPPVRKIFEAMKTHGLIVADNGTSLYVQGTYDTRWDNDVLNPAFAAIEARDLEVIALGWRPAVGGEDPPTAPSNLRARASGRRRAVLSWRDNATDEDGFVIERRLENGFAPVSTAPAGATGGTVTGLAPGTRHVFRVRARNSAGLSAPSNRVAVRTPP